ncbi:thioester reductase domain-containing protein [Legionella bononiensis]|uniref:Thioester reductase domain-containing protein n=1 Tax=Legionella bononiensis TaxID=2793102 RepID=A0ABS1W7P4_9GAMM|nr:thioester reductase domain-containing protein [Legionella bononiensis]MBL7480115.1 thioester reductase domain-containing protein [Legionella bononiensis]MBL7525370.1 thioester reductase domain-containing protein [Legionella bononiensis]MBL7561554.1 thioester reductase domain-containing protein [Legionella bononiensis]
MECITDAIHHHSITKPNQTALAWVNQKGIITESMNYRELSKSVNQTSAFLSNKMSLRSGDKAILLFTKGTDFIVTFLACVQSGIIPIPLKHPHNTKKFSTLLTIINECQPQCIISSEPLDTSELCSVPWIKYPGENTSDSFQRPDNYPDIAFLQFTSGSISAPKGVMVSHDNLIHNLKLIGFYLTNKPSDQVVASWLPHYHDMGLIGAYLASLYHGSTGYYMAPTTFMTNPNAFLQLISDTKATLIQCPNAAYEFMVSQWDKREVDLSSLDNVINAAEPIHCATLEKFYETFQSKGLRKEALKPTYGLAEATLFVTQANTPVWKADDRKVSCGYCPDIDIQIVDPHTRIVCKEGTEGEIWLHSKSNALGYYNKPDLTEEVFNAKIIGCSKNYLKTGDLGFMKDQQLYITGRIKEIMICNGVNIYPHDIEYTVEQFPEIQPHGCVAVSWEDHFETKIVIIAEVKNKNRLPDMDALVQFILQNHDIPLHDLVLCSRYSLPKTTSGKIKRLACKQLYKEQSITALKQLNGNLRITHFIQEDPGQNHKTFYELGVDSLTITHLHVQLTQKISPKYCNELLASRLYSMRLSEYQNILNATSIKEQNRLIANWLKRFKNDSKTTSHHIKNDARLHCSIEPSILPVCPKKNIHHILLTGSTGFIGAYLCFNLLKMTNYQLVLLVNAADKQTGLSRVLNNLKHYGLLDRCQAMGLEQRISILCGNLAMDHFGLDASSWQTLAQTVDSIYHNGAVTHYLSRYEDLKPSNVDGTKTIIQLATTHRLKYIHYISTTLIFGWTPTKLLVEDTRNTAFKYVDFGYAESKWVAEQLIWQSEELGVPIQIYRPAMVTASSENQYTDKDIVARSLVYLLNHRVAITLPNQISFMPVDETAEDIIAISLLEHPKHKVYHLAAEYANLPMICRYITEQYHYSFNSMSLAEFNEHLQQHATEQDLIYPLVSFFNNHYKKIAKMDNKRYCRNNYLEAKKLIRAEPYSTPLHKTLDFIMNYLQNNKLIQPATAIPLNQQQHELEIPK